MHIGIVESPSGKDVRELCKPSADVHNRCTDNLIGFGINAQEEALVVQRHRDRGTRFVHTESRLPQQTWLENYR